MLKKASSPTMPKVVPSATSVAPLISPSSPPSTPNAVSGSGDGVKSTGNTVSSPTMKMRLSHMLHNATHHKTKDGALGIKKGDNQMVSGANCGMNVVKYPILIDQFKQLQPSRVRRWLHHYDEEQAFSLKLRKIYNRSPRTER
ncbi:hypothetical protein PoB_000699600 [Plakobranchus ocellatus]|uniref:Uncharacterized protein n=1 Tax=Plakobranchus ocellatus TaxID=259542 RepID=A0AAV3YBD6_9GAST|nr:hypothetical protein PoB_000699600 [Plakobranchus ocellatus]